MAKDILLDVLAHAEQDSLAGVLFELSQIYVDEGDLLHAQTYLKEGLPLAQDDPPVLASILYGLGDNAWRLSHHDEARDYLMESLKIAREIKDDIRALFAVNRLAVLAAVQQDFKEAQSRFEQCYDLAQKIGNRERACVAIGNLGQLSAMQGDYLTAREQVTRALEIAQELDQQYSIVMAMINLAHVNLQLEDSYNALSQLKNAMRIAQDSNLITPMLGVIVRYAPLCATQGDTDAASSYLGFAKAHPALESDVKREIDELLETLPPNPAKLKAGEKLKLETIVNHIMKYEI